MSAENELAIIIGRARERWTRYVEDCNPVDELDEQGRTLDQAIAARVSAELVGLRERLQAAESVMNDLAEALSGSHRLLQTQPVARRLDSAFLNVDSAHDYAHFLHSLWVQKGTDT